MTTLIFKEVKSQGNPQFINVSLFVDKNSLLNFSAMPFQELDFFLGTFTFAIPKNVNDKKYQNRVLKSTVNLCKLTEGAKGNFVTNMLMENLEKSANFE